MNNKILTKFCIAVLASCNFASIQAQDIYTVEQFSNNDLIGTARYVGMGGSMSALGADISVMGINPAGIGLFRRSVVEGSMSYISQSEGEDFYNRDKNHLSFDELGFVWCSPLFNNQTVPFFNFGFNYQKKNNLNELLSGEWINGSNGGVSLTNEMADIASSWGVANDYSVPLSQMGYETYLIDKDPNNEGSYLAFYSNNELYQKASWGGIQEFDFDFSVNIQEQVYLGMTLGVHDVDYHSFSSYAESYKNADKTPEVDGDYVLSNSSSISGSGVDVVIGGIFRPFYDDPFRFGLSISTPTFYKLDVSNTSHLYNYPESADQSAVPYDYGLNYNFEYNINTPWRFNISVAEIFAKCLAVNLEYEYADYSSAKVNYDDNGYNESDFWNSGTTDDHELNNEISSSLRGVSTFKAGLEYKPIPEFAIRFGYNYQASSFNNKAYLNPFINSASIDYFSSGAYMNKHSLTRFTTGIGLFLGKYNLDVSYVYQSQSADLYAFYSDSTDGNELESRNVKLDKSQITFTLGYSF